MQLRINYFAKPSAPGVQPSLLSCPVGDCDSIEHARKIALTGAENPHVGATHSITIESLDDQLTETWTRNGDNWELVDA
jgi:hypothetical protein